MKNVNQAIFFYVDKVIIKYIIIKYVNKRIRNISIVML